MTVYDKSRQRLHQAHDNELSALELSRDIISNAEYWEQYQKITERYIEELREVDSAERTRASLLQARDGRKTADRPEYTYVDILGQLKAQKVQQLFSELAAIGTQAHDDNALVSSDDKFWQDKKDPMEVFESWWQEELAKLPSISDIEDFLRRVCISDRGYLTYKDGDLEKSSGKNDTSLDTSYLISVDSSVLNKKTQEAMRVSRSNKRQEEIRKAIKKNPLLARQNIDKFIKAEKDQKSKKSALKCQHEFENIVRSNELPIDLENLLILHIESVCIPKGVRRADAYQNMLNQFLRYVEDPKVRLNVVSEAIQRGWRTLSDGSF